MHIAVDARALYASGIGRYTRELLAAISRAPAPPRLTLAGEPVEIERWREEYSIDLPVTTVPEKGGRYAPAFQYRWRRIARAAGPGAVWWFPHWDVPFTRWPARSMVTVPDTIYWRVPGSTSAWRRMVASRWVSYALKRASSVVTVSETTRQDLAAVFGPAGARAIVVPNAVSPRIRLQPGTAPLSRYGVEPGRYVLCVANRKPHKNLEAAVRVLASVRETHPGMRLAVVGEWFPHWRTVEALAAQLKCAAHVTAAGAVSDDDLSALYTHAAVYLHPSRYEGFGLPLIEAMQCGAPVVAARGGATAGTCGNAARLCDPDDHSGMARAVLDVLAGNAERAEMRERGFANAARFSWEESAQALLAIAERIE